MLDFRPGGPRGDDERARHRMIRIGTLVKGDKDPARVIRELAPLGFESFSVMFWQTLGSVDLPLLARDVRAAAEETGTVLSSVSIYGNILLGDTAAAETLRGFQQLIAEARTFGTTLVTGFTGRLPDRPIEQSLGPWKSSFEPLVKQAEDAGVRLAMENCRMGGSWKHGSWNLAICPDAWEILFHEIPSAALGLEWEPCHQLLCLADPLAQLERWAPRIYHVHGKDAHIDWDVVRNHGVFGARKWAVQRTAGFGDSDWTAIMRTLAASGYDGTIDIEGWNDPVYKNEREIEGQTLGLRHLKECREKAWSERVQGSS
jgi:sugar phosphate isomerase/epimerase